MFAYKQGHLKYLAYISLLGFPDIHVKYVYIV